MSSDTVSLLFPDRPIRPLPKRRLRERLSPEVAGSIKYPSSINDNIPLFYYPSYITNNDCGSPIPQLANPPEQSRRNEPILPLGRGAFGLIRRSDEGTVLRSTLVARPPPEILGRAVRPSPRLNHSPVVDPQPPPSATSSVDGYESFENTNNKKKRKIPTAGESALNGAHPLNEISSLALSVRTTSPVGGEFVGDKSQQSIPKLSSQGPYMANNQDLSGSGRGRLGRSRNARSPLRTLPDSNGPWPARPKPGQTQSSSGQRGSSIISNAIANAERSPFQGQKNISLLLQHSATGKVMPASTQFTFTCESQVPGVVQWPGNVSRHGVSSQGAEDPLSAANPHLTVPHNGSSKAGSGQSSNFRTKSRRRLEKELVVAARHRRQLAANNYFHHPPKGDDVWICEFCEYERIFGEPPRTLIRDYEIKDRRHRQEEADRKRLLEKAKAKSRKGKRVGKGAAKGNATTNMPADQQLQVEPLDDADAPQVDLGQSHSTQSEDDYDDCEDDCSNLPRGRINDIPPGHGNNILTPGAKT